MLEVTLGALLAISATGSLFLGLWVRALKGQIRAEEEARHVRNSRKLEVAKREILREDVGDDVAWRARMRKRLREANRGD